MCKYVLYLNIHKRYRDFILYFDIYIYAHYEQNKRIAFNASAFSGQRLIVIYVIAKGTINSMVFNIKRFKIAHGVF